MNNFEVYAKYYDLLYSDKDYHKETIYIENLLSKNSTSKINTVLNLGCGTGKHDLLLAEQGYEIVGVDLSQDMISEANKALLKKGLTHKASFLQGDARSFHIAKTFDAVISLFHVASYQTSNQDILQFFNTASRHLKAGGIFIFDCWYGPAVLTDPPVVRIKRLKNDQITVSRIAEPVMHPNTNVVDVNYEVLIYDNQNTHIAKFHEKHPMRYYFYPECQSHLQTSQFDIIDFQEWLTGKTPDFNSWNVVFVCRKK